MEQQIMLLAFLIIGIVTGVVATWLILRNRIAITQTQAKNESELENARLNERFLAIQEENSRNQQAINEREQQINTYRNQLSDIQNQRTQLEERASRVAPLEQQLEKYTNGIAGFREQITKLSTQLAERTQEQQATEQRLQAAINTEKSTREKSELLLSKLQEETNRNATLAEQVIYLPELQKKLNKLETEQNQLNLTLADYREKIGASETTLSHQSEQIKKLSQERENLTLSKTELTQHQQELTAKVAELTAQLTERIQAQETIEQHLQAVVISEKAIKEKTELLQAKLQEETNRNAKLAEQVAYLPESLEKITKLEAEQAPLNQALANHREKIGASETTINHQIEQIKQLGEEKDNLTLSKTELTQQQQELMAKVAELTAQLESEHTQSLEKIELLNELEQQLEKHNETLKVSQEQITKLSTQLTERVQGQQALEQRLQSAVTSEKAIKEKAELLQEKLQEETNRNATLAEQVAYLPESLEKITKLEAEQTQLNQALANHREKIGASETTINHQIEQIKRLGQEKDNLALSKTELTQHQQELMAKVAELTMQLESERALSGEKIELLNEAKTQLTDQFKALANDILEEKSKRFTEQNQTNIEQVLSPLKIKLHEFQGKIEEVYIQEGKDRSALAEQVRNLMSLNKQLSQDAHNLTSALKGQSKTQGNWGEFILERVLENSGLTKGEHYVTQASHNREDGTRAQPDVIINLPESRHLVIDAKMSIIAYNDYANSDNDLMRDAALKRHIDSVRSHIKGLSSKNYQELYQLKSLDFVIMFVPVEPAFMLAIAQDSNLWQDAWTKNVLLVSPSTLLFVVRTVAHLWRQEQQTRNAQDIAKRGAELYDKLVGFVTDFEKIGDRLNQAQKSYVDAFGKLKDGRGSVIRQAEMLKELGVKPTKSLPPMIVELGLDN
jgi:DNA recombination protein RmuC